MPMTLLIDRLSVFPSGTGTAHTGLVTSARMPLTVPFGIVIDKPAMPTPAWFKFRQE
jgi:hypothetical protein